MHHTLSISLILAAAIGARGELEYTSCVTNYKDEHLMSCFNGTSTSGTLVPSNHCFIAYENCEMEVYWLGDVQTDLCNATKWKWACRAAETSSTATTTMTSTGTSTGTSTWTTTPTSTSMSTETSSTAIVSVFSNPTSTTVPVTITGTGPEPTGSTCEVCSCSDWKTTTFVLLALLIMFVALSCVLSCKLKATRASAVRVSPI